MSSSDTLGESAVFAPAEAVSRQYPPKVEGNLATLRMGFDLMQRLRAAAPQAEALPEAETQVQSAVMELRRCECGGYLAPRPSSHIKTRKRRLFAP
ncbi:hypothetical protein [Chitinimonas sp.]|uniref:hypothetical protein n=1 Tax=Chitinimonas sp. TaxID=1934313 RepID=UPI0035B1E8E4